MEYLIVLILVCLCIFIFLNYIIASHFSEIAELKGHDSKFWFCFFFGIVGWIYVISLPDLISRENQESLIDIQEKILLEMKNTNQSN